MGDVQGKMTALLHDVNCRSVSMNELGDLGEN
jgi:hypothetical protein